MRRSLTFEIPVYLLDQISKRANINGRSRNSEIRHLFEMGMGYAGQFDTSVVLPGKVATPWVQTATWVEYETRDALKDRGLLFGRSTGREAVRVLAYAIEESTRRDMAVINAMMAASGSAELCPQ
jgi:hypothetical protein